MNKFIIIPILLLAMSSSAAVRTTVNDGDFLDPNTWDCSCFPFNTDDAIIFHDVTQVDYIGINNLTIKSGGSLTATNYTDISGDVIVESGASWSNTEYLWVDGNYHMDGDHTTTDYVFMETAGSQLSGTGTVTLNSWFLLRNGTKTILPGTDLEFIGGYGLYAWSGSTTITNQGSLKMNWLGGIDTYTWLNDAGSVIDINRWFFGDFSVNASTTNNEVIFSGNNQTLIDPLNSQFYNLTLISNDISNTKFLSNDVIILNDLNINTTEFDANNFNVEIRGDWIDIDGRFDPTTTRVTFSGTDQLISATSGTEIFNDVNASSTIGLSLDTRLNLAGTLVNTTTLNANGYRIDLGLDWVNNGVFNHGNNTVRMRTSSASSINGDTEFYNLIMNKNAGTCTNNANISIRRMLRLNSGLFETGDQVTMLSDAIRTARVDRISNGSISGDIIAQRYFPTTTDDWHLLASPVQNRTLVDWNDDLLTMGFPGSDYPSFYFNNATYYDESFPGCKDEGLLNANSINDIIAVGQGWRLFLPIDVTTIDVKGPISVGNVNIPISYNGSGSSIDDGWNLIGNPYMSTIDWDAGAGWVKTNINDAVYVWNPSNGQYATYVGGVGTNGGSNLIPSTQAFWVQSFANGPLLTITEDAKSSADVAFKNKIDQHDYFKIVINNSSGFEDEVAIRTSPNATIGFDRDLDALEIKSVNPGVPGISVQVSDELEYSIYSFPHGISDRIIDLKVTISQDGSHKLSFDNLDVYDDFTCLGFYDNVTEEFIFIDSKTVIELDLEVGEYTHRFSIKICPPIDNYIDDVDLENKSLADSRVHVSNQGVEITFSDELTTDVMISIYDIAGREIYNETHGLLNSRSLLTPPIHVAGHYLYVISNLDSGEIQTEKIVISN